MAEQSDLEELKRKYGPSSDARWGPGAKGDVEILALIAELEQTRTRLAEVERERERIKKVKNCYYECVSKAEADKRINELGEQLKTAEQDRKVWYEDAMAQTVRADNAERQLADEQANVKKVRDTLTEALADVTSKYEESAKQLADLEAWKDAARQGTEWAEMTRSLLAERDQLHPQLADERARVERLLGILKGIQALAIEWDANKMGSLDIHRRRWRKLGALAAAAVVSPDAALTDTKEGSGDAG